MCPAYTEKPIQANSSSQKLENAKIHAILLHLSHAWGHVVIYCLHINQSIN